MYEKTTSSQNYNYQDQYGTTNILQLTNSRFSFLNKIYITQEICSTGMVSMKRVFSNPISSIRPASLAQLQTIGNN